MTATEKRSRKKEKRAARPASRQASIAFPMRLSVEAAAILERYGNELGLERRGTIEIITRAFDVLERQGAIAPQLLSTLAMSWRKSDPQR